MTVSLTLSGNEITDAVRLARIQGDGIDNGDSSIGIWEATTNLCTNGGFETSVSTAWGLQIGGTSTTRTRDTTRAKFGSASAKMVRPDAAGYCGWQISTVSGTGGQTYTVSMWVYNESCGTGDLGILFTEVDGGAAGDYYTTGFTTPVGEWTRISVTRTINATCTQIRCGVFHRGLTGGPTEAGETWYVDGVQLENQPLATPYVETDGSTATRSASDVDVPLGSLLDETQSWVAIRLRVNWASNVSGIPINYPVVFMWNDDASNRIGINFISTGAAQIAAYRQTAAGAQQPMQATSFAAGDMMTIIAKWDASVVGISTNGGAFTTAAGTPRIPTLAATTFSVGMDAASGWTDTDIFCFACGTGTLSDADAALIHDLLDTQADHVPSDFPGTCTMVWHCRDNIAYVPGDDVIRGRGLTGAGD